MDGQDAARRLVDAMLPVLGREVHWQQRGVPIVGYKDALLAVEAALQQRGQRQIRGGFWSRYKPEGSTWWVKRRARDAAE